MGEGYTAVRFQLNRINPSGGVHAIEESKRGASSRFQLNRINPSGGEGHEKMGSWTRCFQLNRINPSGGVLFLMLLFLTSGRFPTKPH